MDSTASNASRPLGKPVRRGLAITSLILGILGTMCLGIITGIPAIITGVVARRRERLAPEVFGGRRLATTGMVLGLVSFVTTALLVVALVQGTRAVQQQMGSGQCAINLRRVGIAMQVHAIDHQGAYPASLLELRPTLKTPQLLWCPADTNRPAITNWNDLASEQPGYELLVPGGLEGEQQTNAVVRCPIHGNVWLGNGRVRMARGGEFGP